MASDPAAAPPWSTLMLSTLLSGAECYPRPTGLSTGSVDRAGAAAVLLHSAAAVRLVGSGQELSKP